MNTHQQTNARYSALANSMVAGSFSPDEFSHLDHIAVAFELLKHHEFLDAAAIYSRAIRTFAESHGAEGKYNTTITLAFLSIVAERMSVPGQSFSTFISHNEDLLSIAILENWYTREQLDTEFARHAFLMPGQTPRIPV